MVFMESADFSVAGVSIITFYAFLLLTDLSMRCSIGHCQHIVIGNVIVFVPEVIAIMIYWHLIFRFDRVTPCYSSEWGSGGCSGYSRV